jgi:hypothetical protein
MMLEGLLVCSLSSVIDFNQVKEFPTSLVDGRQLCVEFGEGIFVTWDLLRRTSYLLVTCLIENVG